jgi:hypothetical protein
VTDQATTWVPAFPSQRPPFQKGNQLAATYHGAYSPRRVDPLAAELVAVVLDDPQAAHAHASHHRPALWAWARAEAQVQLLTEYLAVKAESAGDGIGDLDDDRVKAAYLLLHRAEARALSGRARLGLDPLSQARLGRDRAAASVDMASLMAQLAKLEAAGVSVLDHDGNDDGGDDDGGDDD